jgi:hypothetical protein
MGQKYNASVSFAHQLIAMQIEGISSYLELLLHTTLMHSQHGVTSGLQVCNTVKLRNVQPCSIDLCCQYHCAT